MASLHLVGAEANTCAPWGGARSFIFLFFSRCERALRRVPNARRIHDFFLCNAPAFTFKHCESSKEELRVRSRLLKNCKKNSKSVCLLLEVQYFRSLSESCRM